MTPSRLAEIEAEVKEAVFPPWIIDLANEAIAIARRFEAELKTAHAKCDGAFNAAVERAERAEADLKAENERAVETVRHWFDVALQREKERDAARAERDGYFNRSEAFKLQAREARAEAEALRVALRSVGSQAGMGPGNLDDARRLLESIEETARKALTAGAATEGVGELIDKNGAAMKAMLKAAAEPPAKPCDNFREMEGCAKGQLEPGFRLCQCGYYEERHAPPKPEPRAKPNKWCAPSCNHFAERLGAENKATHHELFQPSNGAPILIARCDAHCECDRPASQGGK